MNIYKKKTQFTYYLKDFQKKTDRFLNLFVCISVISSLLGGNFGIIWQFGQQIKFGKLFNLLQLFVDELIANILPFYPLQTLALENILDYPNCVIWNKNKILCPRVSWTQANLQERRYLTKSIISGDIRLTGWVQVLVGDIIRGYKVADLAMLFTIRQILH